MPRPVSSKIDRSYMKSVSYSQYSLYRQCNHQWYLNYVKKLKIFKPSVYLTFGTSFHETLQNYLDVMYNSSIKEADSINLHEDLKNRMLENYQQSIAENSGAHFISKKDFTAFIQDGCNILDWIKKYRAKYFSTKSTKLVGIEIPLEEPIIESIPNVYMQGFIDLVFYCKETNIYTIYDIKTSTSGWKEEAKKDKLKISQLLIYKRFYAKAFNVSEDNIEVKFFIVKRRPFASEQFPAKWIQEFTPAQGKKTVQTAINEFENFVKDCFTPETEYIDKAYPKNTGSCKYCPFSDKPDLCNKK
jgi:hypothetical protein